MNRGQHTDDSRENEEVEVGEFGFETGVTKFENVGAFLQFSNESSLFLIPHAILS